MNKRDKRILSDLTRFRVLDRNQIIELYFSNLKESVRACNRVLNRLVRDNLIEVDRTVRPFNYFPIPSIKKNSTKILHFKEIANFYIEVCRYGKPSQFDVEHKTGVKGNVEPDIFMIWKGVPFYVEVQRNFYAAQIMNKKMKRYKEYYESREWRKHLKHFPYIWIITDRKYHLHIKELQIIQTKTVREFVNMSKKRQKDKLPK